MASVLEEILFRGIIQESSTMRWGAFRGILITSLIFGAIHIIPQQAVNAFFLALVIGYVYHVTGSLMPVIILHALNNGFSSLIFHLNRGNIDTTLAELIKNPTLYSVIYTIAATSIIISAITIYYKVGKKRREKDNNNVNSPL